MHAKLHQAHFLHQLSLFILYKSFTISKGVHILRKAGMLSLKLEISVEFLKFRKSVYKRIFEQRCYMLIYHNLYDDFLRPETM